MRIRSQEIVLLFLFFLESDLKFAQPTKLRFPLLVFLSFFFAVRFCLVYLLCMIVSRFLAVFFPSWVSLSLASVSLLDSLLSERKRAHGRFLFIYAGDSPVPIVS